MPTSATTLALMDLLKRWPRRVISDTLRSLDDAEVCLLEGRILLPEHAQRQRPLPAASFEHAVGYFDEAFPAALRFVPDPPLVLYVRGNLSLFGRPSLAVVGSRRATRHGAVLARTMAKRLAGAGCLVVSGLAYGIDASAHAGALAYPASTIAVLGGGLSRVYPAVHSDLARRILDSAGLLVSEYPDDASPRPHHFPERNRIISGLSNGVLVIEASENSGSLITARLALEQGRDVYAVPGSVQSPVSAGCHRLIQEGAALVTSPETLLEELGIDETNEVVEPRLDEDPQRLLALIREASNVTLDELAQRLNWDTPRLVACLTELELAGFVRTGAEGYIAPL